VLLFTSFVIFPPLIVLEIIENVVFPPGKQSHHDEEGTAPIQMWPGTMCAMDGVVTHHRSEQVVQYPSVYL